jgi:ABC-type sugar transport system ATPase subunit
MAKIELEGISKKFGNFTAIKDLSLTINDKELIVFLGPSGCGKTTTINIIAGIERPNKGKIYFNDMDISAWPPHKRNVSMVFQSSLLYPHLSARRNIEKSLQRTALSKNELSKKTVDMAKLVGVDDLLDKYPFEMSGGQRQRVATAKALVRNPSVFLLDEPLGSVDAAMREDLRIEIVSLQKNLSVTMVFVTHDQTEAMTIGDRIAVMCDGQLYQIDKPNIIYNKPYNMFVAKFIGSPSMNLFQGELVRKNGDIQFVFQGGEINLPKRIINLLKQIPDKRKVTLGIRPHRLKIIKSQRVNTLSGHIFGIEQLGNVTVFTLEGKNGQRVRAVQPTTFSYHLKDQVYLKINSEDIYLFDSSTEKNIEFEVNTTR